MPASLGAPGPLMHARTQPWARPAPRLLGVRVVAPGPAPELGALLLPETAAHSDDGLELVEGGSPLDPFAQSRPDFVDDHLSPKASLLWRMPALFGENTPKWGQGVRSRTFRRAGAPRRPPRSTRPGGGPAPRPRGRLIRCWRPT